jgi:hypothetical protein
VKRMILICGMTVMTVGSAAWADGAATGQVATTCQTESQMNSDECLLLPPVGEVTEFTSGLTPVFTTALIISVIAAAADGSSTSTPSATP